MATSMETISFRRPHDITTPHLQRRTTLHMIVAAVMRGSSSGAWHDIDMAMQTCSIVCWLLMWLSWLLHVSYCVRHSPSCGMACLRHIHLQTDRPIHTTLVCMSHLQPVLNKHVMHTVVLTLLAGPEVSHSLQPCVASSWGLGD